MNSPKPAAPPRPIYGYVMVGRTRLHVKIDWDEYERERAAKNKVPTHFTVHGFNKTFRVARERLTFDPRYKETSK